MRRRGVDLELLFIELKYVAADLRRMSPNAARLLDVAADELDRFDLADTKLESAAKPDV